jgi:diaminopimelate decarboxylase
MSQELGLRSALLPVKATISPEGELYIAGHSVVALAQQYGTPLYVFDRATIVAACQQYQQMFQLHYSASPIKFAYASKAYLAPRLVQLIHEQGMSLDVVSGGELLVAQRAEFPMQEIFFHGNNKSEEELRLALRLGVGRIVLDNWYELERLTKIAHEVGIRPQVLVRIAPEVMADTHRYLQTGHAAAKFGFGLSNGEAQAALLRIVRDDQLDLHGLHAHTGTMLRETRPFTETLERLLQLAYEVQQETGWWPDEVSPGGGWGIATLEEAQPGLETLAMAFQQTMLTMTQQFALPAPTLTLEPGRSIVARAGIAIYRIGGQKITPGGVQYLFIDGGMADNIRPALYGAQYTALPVTALHEDFDQEFRIAGRYCESGDIQIENVTLPTWSRYDLLCLPTSGAYCLPMASNYNLVPRPAVLLVDENEIYVMERRETYDDLLVRYL